MIKLLFKSYYSVFIFILISQPAFSAEGMNYKSFLGITLDEKFWVLIAFILFIILVSKKATNAANTALDNRSNVIKDKISSLKKEYKIFIRANKPFKLAIYSRYDL